MKSTPHIAPKGEFAKVVLMPGDPLRAKLVAETLFEDAVLINEVRGILAYTGTTESGKKMSVMASGMGIPSIGIYATELYDHFGVETIIRIGTAGAYQKGIALKDLIFAMSSSTDSNFLASYNLNGTYSACCDYQVLEEAVKAAKAMGIPYHVGNVFSSDVFYDHDPNTWKKWAGLNVLGVDMESYALYAIAAEKRRRALSVLTVSNSFLYADELTAEERQTSLLDMIKVAIKAGEAFSD